MNTNLVKSIVSRTNALLVALTLAVTAAAVAAPVASASGGDCNFTNYGVYNQIGDYNCESNDSFGNTYCYQGTGAGAGAGGAGKPSAAAGATTNCDGGNSGTVDRVAASGGADGSDAYLL